MVFQLNEINRYFKWR